MEKEDKPAEEEKKRLASLARYSAMGFQMFAIMALSAFAGVKLDAWLQWKFPAASFVFTIAGLILALYYFIRDLDKQNPRKH